jgi:hypothetical protein
MSCPEITTDLSVHDAFLVLEPYFAAMQEVFRESGLVEVERTKLYCAPWIHDTPRHFAACRDDGLAIIVAPELAELPEPTVVAIFGHELGHAVDYLYPAQFVLGKERDVLRRARADGEDLQWARWVKAWEKRDTDVVEQTADGIAELVTGARIGYLGPCQLQSFNRGQARPQGLR